MKLSIRSMIVAPKGKVLLAFDLSQAESWIVAFSANEPNMKRALMYGDIHTETAGNALFFSDVSCAHSWHKLGDNFNCSLCDRQVTKIMRYVGKRYNHASSYRMGPDRAAQVINKDSDKPPFFTITVKQSRVFSERWHSYYNLKPWWSWIEHELSTKRTLTTTYGRERMFFDAWGNELFKKGTAFIPQGGVADHFNGKIHPIVQQPGGLIEIYRKLIRPYKDRRIVNQSHDSAMMELPYVDVSTTVEEIKPIMLRPIVINNEEFTIPLDIEVGDRWGELDKAA